VAGGAPVPTPASALNSSIGYPGVVALDGFGNFYFASNHAVYRIDKTGTLTRVAGNARDGYSGDGGPATSAQLSEPQGIAIDGTGNLFIADGLNQRIRKVATDGSITTIAGNGYQGPPGILSGTGGHTGDGGQATSAEIEAPRGIAVDGAGNVYFLEFFGSIRKVTPDGLISTLTITGAQGPGEGDGFPAGFTIDTAGNLYVTDAVTDPATLRLYGVVRKITPAGVATIVAGGGNSTGDGGPATSAHLTESTGLAVDGGGNLYIVEYFSEPPTTNAGRIRKVTTSGLISTVAGGGTGSPQNGAAATSVFLNGTTGVAVDASGNCFFSETYGYTIRKVDAAGTLSTLAGNGLRAFSGDGGPAASAQLADATDVAVDSAGNLFIADTYNSRVRKVSPGGQISTVMSGIQATGVAVDHTGNVAVASVQGSIVRLATDGSIKTIASFGGDNHAGMAFDGSGNLFIADCLKNVVLKVFPDGTVFTMAGTGTAGFSGDGGPAARAQLQCPSAVAVDTAGNVLIADRFNGAIRKVSTDQTISTLAKGLNPPSGITVDALGNVFIAAGSQILELSANGTLTTIAGNGNSGYAGDGGAATLAQLSATAVAVDKSGNLFIGDDGNAAVRQLTPAAALPTCPSQILPSNVSFAASGGFGSFSVQALSSCTWNPVPNSGWITELGPTSPGGVTGAGAVYFQIAANSAGQARTGTISVGISTFTISQDGAACSYNLYPGSLNFDSGGGSQSILLSTPPGCAWNAGSGSFWLSSGTSSGKGTTRITVRAAINSGTARTGDIAIAGQSLTVTQGAGDATVCGSTDVTPRVSVARTGLAWDPPGYVFSNAITVRNTSGSAIAGPVYLVLVGLPTHFSYPYNTYLLGSQLETSCFTAAGDYLIPVASGLAPGQAAGVPLVYVEQSASAGINYQIKVLSGQPTH
jgi:sugar lactone lactonase YvrE